MQTDIRNAKPTSREGRGMSCFSRKSLQKWVKNLKNRQKHSKYAPSTVAEAMVDKKQAKRGNFPALKLRRTGIPEKFAKIGQKCRFPAIGGTSGGQNDRKRSINGLNL